MESLESRRLLAGGPESLGAAAIWPLPDGNLLLAGGEHSGTTTRKAMIWRTDGTPAGTTPVFVGPSPIGAEADALAYIGNIGNRVVFSYLDRSTQQNVIASTDGTPAGTVKLGTGFAKLLGQLNGKLVIRLNAESAATTPVPQVIVTDGTVAGTKSLRTMEARETPLRPGVVLGGKLYFTWGFNEVWQTDGTAAGTKLVNRFTAPAGTTVTDAMPLVASGRLLVSVTQRPGPNLQTVLYITNGTAAGTTPIATLPSIEGTFDVHRLVDGSALLGPTGWRTDGTAAGTYRLASTFTAKPGQATVDYAGFTYVLDRTRGIWRTDGSAAGTTRVSNLADASELKLFNNRLYVVGTSTEGRELMQFRPSGTALSRVEPLNTGSTGPSNLTVYNGTLIFRAVAAGGQFSLWRTLPGGLPQRVSMPDDVFTPGLYGLWNDIAFSGSPVPFFMADQPSTGYELWKYDAASNSASVALDAPFSSTPIAPSIAPATVAEGASVRLAVANAPAGSTFAWDFDGDGRFGETGTAAARGDEVGAAPVFRAVNLTTRGAGVVLRLNTPANGAFTLRQTVAVTPASPVNFTAAKIAGGIELRWQRSGTIAYQSVVERSLDGVTWTRLTTTVVDTTRHVDATAVAGKTYLYRVGPTASTVRSSVRSVIA